jgi:hypothetical protein
MKTNQAEYYEKYKIWYDKKGYAVIWINGKSIKLHVYIWEKSNGEKPKGYDIHHKDFNKSNYILSNLELLTLSDHRRLHAGWERLNGKWIKKPCSGCNEVLSLDKFYFCQVNKKESSLCKRCHDLAVKKRLGNPVIREKNIKYKHDYWIRKKNVKSF